MKGLQVWLPRVALLASLSAASARAQTTGTIRGVVETGQTPLPGVSIKALSPRLQGTRTAVTDAEGRFNLTALPPGPYTITALLEGFGTKNESVQLALNQTADVRIEMLPTKTESVTVSAEAAQVDGGFREIGGFNAKDPNITDDFDYPEFVVNSYGKLTIDRPHQVKAQVAYVLPINLTLALSGYYLSGTPLSKVGWWNGYGGAEVFITPRGSEGRSPNIYEMDAHLDYALTIRPVTIRVLADLFNLLNRQRATTIDQVWPSTRGTTTHRRRPTRTTASRIHGRLRAPCGSGFA